MARWTFHQAISWGLSCKVALSSRIKAYILALLGLWRINLINTNLCTVFEKDSDVDKWLLQIANLMAITGMELIILSSDLNGYRRSKDKINIVSKGKIKERIREEKLVVFELHGRNFESSKYHNL
ncbi:hypothetical protein Scep_005014 [Stephania cephalantha]|uniref:Uncharacterized protein n=1 Tax=Stephania cephalantha TaxID=152367 RepID=A0AAP0PX45_9MAGN